MSAPTDDLQYLSLRERTMSSRRSIAQQERRRRENEQRLRASEALRPQQYRHVQPSPRTGTPVAPTTVFESHSGIRYNVTNMPQGAYSLATRALSSHRYLADLAMRHEDEHGSYIAFQLKKLESVRIYDYASIQQPSSLSCTCEDFVSHQWLYDGLNDVLFDGVRDSVHEVDLPSIRARLGTFNTQMTQQLSSLPDYLNLRGAEITGSDDGDDSEVIMVLQDMVSVLDERRLPEEFDEDFVANLPSFQRCYQWLVMPENMPASIFALARYDHVLRDRLRNALPKELCALNFLRKLEKRATNSFERYDEYASSGPEMKPYFISACGNSLRNIVASIVRYQESRGPTTENFDRHAAGLTVRLLIGAVDRDRDIYDPCVWLKERTPPAEPSNRNLFTNLIRTPPSDDYNDASTVEIFGLDLLGDKLRITAWNDLLESLQHLLRRVETAGAPTAFISKLRELSSLDHEAWGQMDPSRSTMRSGAVSSLGSPWTSSWEAGSSRRASSLSRRPEIQERRESRRQRVD